MKAVSNKIKRILDEFMQHTDKHSVLYEASSHLIKAGGKMVRPYLAVKSCEAVGGNGEGEVLKAAAAVEFFHTFTLVHDDIMDNDKIRRGVPSVHSRWNVPVAIIAGDLLFADVFKILTDGWRDEKAPYMNKVRIINLLAEAAAVLCEGQMMDTSFQGMTQVPEEDYLSMIHKKTAWLFKTSAEVGALTGGAEEPYVQCLGKFAELSGMAFQIVDDVLGLEADEETLGKPVGSDLREGKKTLPIIHALTQGSEAQRKIICNAMRKNASQSEINEALQLIRALGGGTYSMKKASQYLQSSLKQLEELPDTEAKKALISLAKFLVIRKS